MGISSSLNASVMGLQANAQRLNGISDNIANSETYGYKRADTQFFSLVNAGNSAANYDAGGVRTSTTREITTQGSLIGTGNATDISINGRGFVPVTTVVERDEPTGDRPFLLTSTGSFTQDADGFLRTANGLQLLGWPTDQLGDVGTVSRDTAADLRPVSLSDYYLAPNQTTQANIIANLPAGATTGEQHLISLEYFDARGTSERLDMTFESVDPALGTWSLTVDDSSSGTIIGDLDLTFETTGVTAGSLTGIVANTGTYDPVSGELTVAGPAGDITIEIGAPNTTSNLTLFDGSFIPSEVSKDGSPLGYLQSVELNSEGKLEGIYDSGFRRALYQIPVADVQEPNGLTPSDGGAFKISVESGRFYLWDSGTGPTGTIEGYTLEESTTDVTEELTHLIETQRAYSSNARIVTTVDEMLQETTNLKR